MRSALALAPALFMVLALGPMKVARAAPPAPPASAPALPAPGAMVGTKVLSDTAKAQAAAGMQAGGQAAATPTVPSQVPARERR